MKETVRYTFVRNPYAIVSCRSRFIFFETLELLPVDNGNIILYHSPIVCLYARSLSIYLSASVFIIRVNLLNRETRGKRNHNETSRVFHRHQRTIGVLYIYIYIIGMYSCCVNDERVNKGTDMRIISLALESPVL